MIIPRIRTLACWKVLDIHSVRVKLVPLIQVPRLAKAGRFYLSPWGSRLATSRETRSRRRATTNEGAPTARRGTLGDCLSLRGSPTCKVLLLALLSTLLTSCGRQIQGPDNKVAEQIFPATVTSVTPTPTSSDLDVYVDGSMSMQGYTVAGSNYTHVLGEVWESATSAQFKLSVFKFNEKITTSRIFP